jgi:hypothetical protein
MANQLATIAFHSPVPSDVEERDPFGTEKLIQIDDSNSQLLISGDIDTPPGIKDQIVPIKLMPETRQAVSLETSPDDYQFICRVDFNREKFFKEVCHIVKPEQDLIKETLRHFESKSKERTTEVKTAIKPKQITEQKRRMPRGNRTKRPGTLGSNLLHRVLSKRKFEVKRPAINVAVKKFKSPVMPSQKSRTLNTSIAAILKNSRKDSLLSTQRKSRSRMSSNALPLKQKINVYSFEVGKGDIGSIIQSRGSPFKTHDIELKDPSNNLYTNRASKGIREMKELSELLEIDENCQYEDVITSVKHLKKELNQSKAMVKQLSSENDLLKMRITLQESIHTRDIKVIERPTMQNKYHSNSKYIQPSFMSKNTTARDYKQAPFESTISMTSGAEHLERGLNHKKGSVTNLTAVNSLTNSGQLRKLKKVLASKATSNIHSIMEGFSNNNLRNITINDRTH